MTIAANEDEVHNVLRQLADAASIHFHEFWGLDTEDAVADMKTWLNASGYALIKKDVA